MTAPKRELPWKIRRDPYLGPLAEERGEEAAMRAGFFFDEDDEDAPLDDVDWLTTPMPKRAGAPRPPGRAPLALLSTGGFCPVHAGHLAMMERAREAAERAGWHVVGGYLSPGHDAYLRMKCGDAAIPVHERLRLCAEAVAGSDWLSVDPWEAMHRRVAVNYTDVTARLRAYLRAHVDPALEVAYVCGGDNARFASAFAEDGVCIVVGRPQAEAEADAWRRELAGNPRVLWAEGDHPAASRALRAERWVAPPPRRLVLRLEDERVVRTLGLGREAYRAFQEALRALLAARAEVRVSELEARTSRGGEGPTLGLDPMRPAAHTLAVSRRFALGGHELRAYAARPGWPSLEEQVAALPPGAYVFEDDDRMTGGTLAAVRALLPPSVTLVGTRFAIERADDEDVLDARDFLVGTDEGGLVVELAAGATGRAPYLLPYVDPAARASVRDAHAFSIAVWQLGARTFAPTPLRVRDLPRPARVVLSRFEDEVPLERVCTWHAERLRSQAPRGA